MAHQDMPKIFHDPHNNPLASLQHTRCTVPYACKTNHSFEKLKSDKISVYPFPKNEAENARMQE